MKKPPNRSQSVRAGRPIGAHVARPNIALVMASIGFLAIVPVEVGVARESIPDTRPPIEEDGRIVHLLNRATYGARPEDVERVREIGIEAWVDEQLDPSALSDPSLEILGERFPAAVQSTAELLERFPPPMVTLSIRRALDSEELSETDRQEIQRELRSRNPGRILVELNGAKLHRAAHSTRQLEEVMTDFWFDHFNVFFGKNTVRWLVADYENQAIRPHVFGSFEEMLIASASHPAMLYYLDNWRSAAPDMARIVAEIEERRARLERAAENAMRRGRAAGRQPNPGEEEIRNRLATLDEAVDRQLSRIPGLNENYARELLELHTLGVDGGYGQDDVVAVARAFTGWTLTTPAREGGGAPPMRPGNPAGDRGGVASAEEVRRRLDNLSYDGVYEFEVRDELHDSNDKVVLGEPLEADGVDEGIEVLRRLARHPSTARHVATQLAVRFVSDTPPENLIDDLARVFLETSGDLGAVTRALFLSEEFDDPAVYGTRIKSPFTLVASALRLTGSEVLNGGRVLESLRTLGNAPYLADAPTGYPEESAVWASGGAMVERFNFGLALASGEIPGIRPDGARLLSDALAYDSDPVVGLAKTLLPGASTDELLEVVREDLATTDSITQRERGMRVVALILGSPEFQRH